MHKRMDWRTVTFDWNRARAFLVTAEEGSLSAAARALGMAQPTLGRQVSALEKELGIVLFERLGRGLVLTQSGLELLEHVRGMGEAANRVSLSASGQSQTVEGTIRITASEITATYILPPLIAKLRGAEPGIAVEIVASNTVSDLRRREADIAIRNGRPTDPSLIARRQRDNEAQLYASCEYLDRVGMLANVEDALHAHYIGFDNNEAYLQGLAAHGLPLTPAHFPVRSTSHFVHWAMVRQGLGIGVAPTAIGDAEVSVRRALPWLAPFVFPVWLVAHRELLTSRRIRLVFDFLTEELAGI